jgi:hypothetical protein
MRAKTPSRNCFTEIPFPAVTDALITDSNAAEVHSVSPFSRLRSTPAVAILAGIFLLATNSANAQTPKDDRKPVLVELFTSEGCSSCPPADALLAKLDSIQPVPAAQIIVLGEHVDYWDGQGWHDRFSSRQFTDRQNQYRFRLHFDSPYTPQMIVDGTDQFVGNDGAHALRAIQHAADTPKLQLTLASPIVSGNKISATVSLAASPTAAPTKIRGDLYAALVDPTDTTQVRSGENGGRLLQHVGVVRVLQRIGSLKDLNSPRQFSLTAPANAQPANMRVVVFAQSEGQGAILGVATSPVTGVETRTASASLTH